MINEIKALSDVVDLPIAVAVFWFMMRQLKAEHQATREQFKECLEVLLRKFSDGYGVTDQKQNVLPKGEQDDL